MEVEVVGEDGKLGDVDRRDDRRRRTGARGLEGEHRQAG
jgi:hypothetical protein